MATPTPDNHVLSSKVATPTVNTTAPVGPAPSSEFPRAVYHRDSTVGNLISQLVATAEALQALGPEWLSLADLHLETAPAEKPNAD